MITVFADEKQQEEYASVLRERFMWYLNRGYHENYAAIAAKREAFAYMDAYFKDSVLK